MTKDHKKVGVIERLKDFLDLKEMAHTSREIIRALERKSGRSP